MKRIYLTIILILAILIIPGVVIASDVTGVKYQGILRISNNSTLATSVSTNFSLNSASLITQGLASSGLTDIAITYGGTDIPFMPGYGSNPWCVFVPSIGENTNLDYAFYTNNASGGNIKYFPGPSGMTINDDPSMEPTDNYTMEYNDVYICNTGNISYKIDAFTLTYGSGNITFTIVGGLSLTSAVSVGEHDIKIMSRSPLIGIEYLRPNAVGDLTELPYQVPASGDHFDKVDEESQDGNTTEVYNKGVSSDYKTDLYNITDTSILAGSTINSVTVGMYTKKISGSIGGSRTVIKTGGVSYNGTLNAGTDAWTYFETVYNTNPQTSLAWTTNELNNLQIGVNLYQAGGVTEYHCTQVFAKINYDYALTEMFIDDILVDSEVTINGIYPNTVNNWQVGSGVTPYLREFTIEIDGTEKCSIDWEYGATFTDDSGNGNDATPTFRTTSSDTDVSASLISLSPVTEAELESWTFGNAGDMFVSDPTMPSQMYTFGDYQYIPGAEVVNALLDAGDYPRVLWWNVFIYLGIAIVSLMLYGPARSVLIMIIVIECVFILFGVIGAIPLAVAYLFPLPGVAIWLSQRHYGVG